MDISIIYSMCLESMVESKAFPETQMEEAK